MSAKLTRAERTRLREWLDDEDANDSEDDADQDDADADADDDADDDDSDDEDDDDSVMFRGRRYRAVPDDADTDEPPTRRPQTRQKTARKGTNRGTRKTASTGRSGVPGKKPPAKASPQVKDAAPGGDQGNRRRLFT